jgi:serine/threonine-protein kinase ATR
MLIHNIKAMSGIKAQEAPPSTLAANLVNNLEPFRDEQADLQKLLLEVSQYERDNGESSPEEIIEHHHKLIYVVTRTVLEVLTKNNPASKEQFLEHAAEGLDVLTATIRETPTVLARSDPPLWIWLFPRLLALVGMERCQVLQEKIKAFFQAAFGAASKTMELWALNSSFFCYLQHCADGKKPCSVSIVAHRF